MNHFSESPMMTDTSATPPAPATSPPSSDMFQQVGLLTRQLHDTLQQLGVMPKLQQAADGLPDARSRLSYIASKSGEAADKVLTSVELAKAEHRRIADAIQHITAAVGARPVQPMNDGVESSRALMEFLSTVDSASALIDGHLTDIMMAQDFHDLTGQVVAKVVSLAANLEDSLVKLLVQSAPPEEAQNVDTEILNGPVVNPQGRADVVSNQSEVDDLLASLGF